MKVNNKILRLSWKYSIYVTRRANAQAIHICHSYWISWSSPLHNQTSQTFELSNATLQQNDCTSSRFPLTLWSWVNINRRVKKCSASYQVWNNLVLKCPDTQQVLGGQLPLPLLFHPLYQQLSHHQYPSIVWISVHMQSQWRILWVIGLYEQVLLNVYFVKSWQQSNIPCVN